MKTICIEAPTVAVTAEWEGHKSGNILITKPSMNEKRVVFILPHSLYIPLHVLILIFRRCRTCMV